MPIDRAVRVAAGLLRRLSVPAPAELRTVEAEVAGVRATAARSWERHGRPFPRALLEEVLDFATAAAPTSAPVVVNQDLHWANVLAGTREPWLVIDPKPLAGDPEFGVAQLLWTRTGEIADGRAFRRRFDQVVDVAGLERDRAHRWSLFRVIDSWLWALDVGLTEDPERCRTLTEWLDEP